MRQPSKAEARGLAPRLIDSDLFDLRCRGLTPVAALVAPIRLCPDLTYAIFVDGRIEAMGGYYPVDEATACPWVLSSKDMGAEPFVVSRLIKMNMKQCSFDILYNYVPAENRQSQRMIRHFGFTLGWPTEFGGTPYLTFVRRRVDNE